MHNPMYPDPSQLHPSFRPAMLSSPSHALSKSKFPLLVMAVVVP